MCDYLRKEQVTFPFPLIVKKVVKTPDGEYGPRFSEYRPDSRDQLDSWAKEDGEHLEYKKYTMVHSPGGPGIMCWMHGNPRIFAVERWHCSTAGYRVITVRIPAGTKVRFGLKYDGDSGKSGVICAEKVEVLT